MGQRRTRRLVGITGTPGTGKKSIAPLVASKLGIPSFSLNELARAFGLLNPGRSEASVDVEVLKQKLATTLLEPSLVYGHLLPYALERSWITRVVVLRCNPLVLRERLRSRGYPPQKILENVEAELIGVISTDTFRAFGSEKTLEFDTTNSLPDLASASITAIISEKGRSHTMLDWLETYDSVSEFRSLLSGASEGSSRTQESTAS